MLVYLVVVIYPSLAGAFYAFTDWSGVGGASFVGLDNFKRSSPTTSPSARSATRSC